MMSARTRNRLEKPAPSDIEIDEIPSETEIEEARKGFRALVNSVRGWRKLLKNPRYHDLPYWMLFSVLFAEKKMRRMDLTDAVKDYAGVSRSTADRIIDKAKQKELIIPESVGKEMHYRLSDKMLHRCLEYHKKYLK